MNTFMKAALEEARLGLQEGGLPIGSVLVKDDAILGKGHNKRIQQGDPMAHAEIDCLRNAGRQKSYRQISRILFEDYGLANDKGKPSNPKTIMVMVSQ